jgi:pseudouridine-5'-phosphate glycosidase
MDISADLPELASTPIVLVCSGAKSLLDLPRTREWLETYGVTILGWQSGEFPGFYSRTSGLTVDERVDKARDVIRIAEARNDLGFSGAVLVTVPVPERFEIPQAECEQLLKDSLKAAAEKRLAGKGLTPFLLSEMAARSGGRTLEANIALLENNARVAARIAAES